MRVVSIGTFHYPEMVIRRDKPIKQYLMQVNKLVNILKIYSRFIIKLINTPRLTTINGQLPQNTYGVAPW